MKILELVLQLLTIVPAIPAPAPAAQAVTGTGTLLVAGCTPGETVEIEPGNLRALVPENGTIKVTVQAQAKTADSYHIKEASGDHPVHGTVSAGETLSAACS